MSEDPGRNNPFPVCSCDAETWMYLRMKDPPQSCSSCYTTWYETDVFEKQCVFCLSVPWKCSRLFCWRSAFKCNLGFAHPLKLKNPSGKLSLSAGLKKKVQCFVNVSGQVEVLLIARWRVEMEKAIPLICWVWRSWHVLMIMHVSVLKELCLFLRKESSTLVSHRYCGSTLLNTLLTDHCWY